MGRGFTENSSSPNLLYGKVDPRRTGGGGEGSADSSQRFDLMMVIDLIEPENRPAAYRFEVGHAFGSIVEQAIKDLAESDWKAPWLGGWLRELAKQGDVEIGGILEMADADSGWWECRLDPDSAVAWCRRHRINLV